jgi:hypothetical protein
LHSATETRSKLQAAGGAGWRRGWHFLSENMSMGAAARGDGMGLLFAQDTVDVVKGKFVVVVIKYSQNLGLIVVCCRTGGVFCIGCMRNECGPVTQYAATFGGRGLCEPADDSTSVMKLILEIWIGWWKAGWLILLDENKKTTLHSCEDDVVPANAPEA